MTCAAPRPVRLGVSTCLLGEPVRYDAGHKRDAFLCDVLGPHVEWVPVCPEVGAGFGVPREPVRLVGEPAAPRLATVSGGVDVTPPMRRYIDETLSRLAPLGLCGWVLKARSPSCGLEGVPVYPERDGPPGSHGAGLFVRALIARFPLLPVEEDEGLRDPARREAFLERVFAFARWQELLASSGLRREGLARFHAAHEHQLLAHSPSRTAALARLVAPSDDRPLADVLAEYGMLFAEALRSPATVARHGKVLEQLAGHLSTQLAPAERAELAELIAGYRALRAPLSAPLGRIRDHVRRLEVAALADQTYLAPHPSELMAPGPRE